MEVTFGVAEEVLSSAAIMEEVTLMQSQQGSGDKCDQGTFYGVEIGLIDTEVKIYCWQYLNWMAIHILSFSLEQA